MTCTHEQHLKCIQCHPEIWHPGDDYILQVNLKILQEIVIMLLNANRAYYSPEDPLVEKQHHMIDDRYNMYKDSLEKQWPEHPIIRMVDWDESMVGECMTYLPEIFDV